MTKRANPAGVARPIVVTITVNNYGGIITVTLHILDIFIIFGYGHPGWHVLPASCFQGLFTT